MPDEAELSHVLRGDWNQSWAGKGLSVRRNTLIARPGAWGIRRGRFVTSIRVAAGVDPA